MTLIHRNDYHQNQLNARLERATPLGRVAEPEEIARIVAFLASDLASHRTATTFTTDGSMMQASVGL